MQRADFDQDFVWGAATASYQIEGAVTEGGRGPSIWDTFSHTPGTILGGDTGDVAVDHLHRMDEDVALMADLGLDAYRFSIAWPRIQPDGSGAIEQRGIDVYRRLCESLLERGITPWATLYHWDLPQALEDAGGWLHRDTAERFADYAAVAAESLGDLVTHWITLNEPWCSAFLGYASGVHAPGRRLGSEASHAAHHLLLGHGLAVPRIRAAVPDARVGITLNLYSVRPETPSDADVDAARRVDGLSNRLFLDPVLLGEYPADVIESMGEADWFAEHAPKADLEAIAAPLDFLGINYYSRHTIRSGPSDAAINGRAPSANPGSEDAGFARTGAPITQMGWEIHPDGMLDVLEMAAERAPGLPLYITENGSAYEDVVAADGTVDDQERTEYLRLHVEACRAAVERGLPLRGYFAWSLLDNFEWAWGYARRFGLVHVDYDTQQRTPKTSAHWYSRFLGGRI